MMLTIRKKAEQVKKELLSQITEKDKLKKNTGPCLRTVLVRLELPILI